MPDFRTKLKKKRGISTAVAGLVVIPRISLSFMDSYFVLCALFVDDLSGSVAGFLRAGPAEALLLKPVEKVLSALP